MTTLPSQQPLRFEGESHQARDMAQSFGSDPERYDRARPSYPAALVERVIAVCPGRDVLDVGCGTGIVARQVPAAGAGKAARSLRPGGRLAVFWNATQAPPDLAEAFAGVFRRVLPDSPLFQRSAPGAEAYSGLSAKAAGGIRETSAFGDPEHWEFEWDRPYTRDEWLEQVPTSGFAVRLQPDAMQQILAGIGAAIDAAGGTFTMHYTTVAVTAAH